MALPRFIVLKSYHNKKYLRYIHEGGKVHTFLQFSGEEVVSPYAKYEVQLANSGKGLVHIRCCYNNKYWVRESPNSWWIVAGANEPEEDQSKWSCTLFKPVYVSGDGDDKKKVVRFLHVQIGHYACLWRVGPPHGDCLHLGSSTPDNDQCDVCTIIDWESLLILPKHVAFKGDNGKYLSACTTEPQEPYLQFSSSDIGDDTVRNEIFTTRDGSIGIKSDFFGKFWRRGGSNWIWANSDDTNSDTLFWPVKVDNNVIALRNLGNNNFCHSLTAEGKTDCLNAAVPTISREARLQVHEAVISRGIDNVKFRLVDARIYNLSFLTIATGYSTNRTQDPNTVDVKLSYTEIKSSTWNSGISMKSCVKTSIQTGVPFITEGNIEISTESDTAFQWGETESSTAVMETAHMVPVPPMTKVRVCLLVTKGSCDVPFSYTQRDTLTNGHQITYDMDDGVYTGINCFNFKYETKQQKLWYVKCNKKLLFPFLTPKKSKEPKLI